MAIIRKKYLFDKITYYTYYKAKKDQYNLDNQILIL